MSRCRYMIDLCFVTRHGSVLISLERQKVVEKSFIPPDIVASAKVPTTATDDPSAIG